MVLLDQLAICFSLVWFHHAVGVLGCPNFLAGLIGESTKEGPSMTRVALDF